MARDISQKQKIPVEKILEKSHRREQEREKQGRIRGGETKQTGVGHEDLAIIREQKLFLEE